MPTASYGAFTLHGTGTVTGTGNGTGTIGDNGCGPIPGPGECKHFCTIYWNPLIPCPGPGPGPVQCEYAITPTYHLLRPNSHTPLAYATDSRGC